MKDRLAPSDPAADTAPDLTSTVAVLAPRGRDASVAGGLLERDGIASTPVATLESLAGLVERRIGAVLITEEALAGAGSGALATALAAQPPWSDVPFIVLANGAVGNRSARAAQRMNALPNAVLLSRPLHAEELVRAVRSALTARIRQHEARRRMEQLQLRERQLYESEAKFHAIANSVDHLIWSARADGVHDYFNDRWYEFTGLPRGTMTDTVEGDMFHPEDRARTVEMTRNALDNGDPFELEYRLRHHDGTFRWVLGRAHAVRDADGQIVRWYGSCTDIHEIKKAQAQRQLMLDEMNHRVKNTLAMVSVMVSQTLRQADNLGDAQTSIQSRIAMMAQAHDRLIGAAWKETRIREVAEAALAPHRAGENRFSIEGPDLPIGSKQALALTMALHELSTNAGKYGALSVDSGEVHVAWHVESLNDTFRFVWTETGGPRVEEPKRRGFGSRMIEQALAGYFEGTAELCYDPCGLKFSLWAPVEGLTL